MKAKCQICVFFEKRYMEGDADGYCKRLEEETDLDSSCFNFKETSSKKGLD